MIARPRFKSHLRVEVRSPELVVAVSESRALALEGRLHPLIVPWIDGSRTNEEIATAAGPDVTALDVAFGIELLQEQGLIEESAELADPWRSAFHEQAGSRFGNMQRAAVVAREGLPAKPLEDALESLGVELGEPAGLTIVLTTDYLLPEVEAPEPWMPVKPAGAVMWFGPVFDGGDGACWNCLTMRLREWRRAETFLPDRRDCDDLRPSAPMPAAALEMALRLAAIEAFRYLSGARENGSDRTLFTFDLARMRLDRHAVAKLEHCPRCTTVKAARGSAIRGVAERPNGAAEAVLQNFGRHISPITGIVNRLESYGVEAPGLAAVCSAPYLFPVETRRRGVTQRIAAGKGATRAEAEASALCEALERYSGVFRGDEITRRARYSELGGEAIHPASLLHFSAAQYGNRETTNRNARAEEWIPVPFEEDRAIDWTLVWPLGEGERRWAPAAYCYYGFPSPADYRFCGADSNGCAAGGTMQEATLSGLLELIERDAVALWWYNRIARQAVAPEALGEAAHGFARHYAALGRRIRLFDITSDLGVPVFAAISWRPERERELMLGFGAGFHASQAAQRALREMHQFLEVNAAPDPRCRLGEDPRDCEFLMTGAEADLSLETADGICPQSLPRLVQDAGLEIFVLDQTRSDVGLPAVKVIVPGLRHFWPRFGPGRLFSVPVVMGWRMTPMTELELNSTRFFC